MSRPSMITAAVLVALILGLSLTVDPFGLFETAVDQEYDPTAGLQEEGRAPTLAGREGVGPEPREWEGDPVGLLVLGPGGATLKGRVTGNEQPLALARVRPVLPPPLHQAAVRTRRDGGYEIRGLPVGQHELRASAEGYVSETVLGPALEEGQSAEVADIDLVPRAEVTNAIEVRVSDEWGRPIPAASVLASTLSWDLHLAMGPELVGMPAVQHKSGRTDENGRVVLGPLEPEEYNVVATAKGYMTTPVNGVQVAEGRTRHVTLRLKEAFAVSGRVLDIGGQPVEGATVMGMSTTSWVSSLTTRTAADGSFLLDGLRSGPYMFIAWDEKLGQVSANGESPSTGVTIRLEGTGTLKGRVRWDDGTPVTAGTVRPFQTGPFQYVYSMVLPIQADGTFEQPWPKGNWNLRAQAADGNMAPDQVASVTVGEVTEVEIVVPRTGIVRGVVVDEGGQHVPSAEIFVKLGGFPPVPSREQYARSDADGYFEVKGLPLEPVKLHVTHAEYADTKIDAAPALPDKAQEQTVRLTRGATLSGRVLDASGRGVPGEQVNLVQSWFEALSTFCNAEGAFAFQGVAAGTYTVTTGPYEQNARGISKAGVQVPEGGAVNLELVYPAALGRLSGEVRMGGAALAGAEVTVQDDRGPDMATRTRCDESGRFAVEGLQYGRVRVVARSADGMSGSASATVSEKDSPTVTITIGAGRVSGRIVDDTGAFVSGAWISLEADEDGHADWGRMRWQGNSGPDGTFQASGLAPGSMRIRVNRAEFAQLLGEPFTLADGQSMSLGDLRLRRGAILSGVVRNDAGVPVEDVTIGVTDLSGRPVFLFSMSTTGSDGRYSLRGLEPGTFKVRFEAQGHAPDEKSVTIRDEGATADGTLTRGGSVTVHVEDEAGQPVPGARIFLYDSRGQLITRTISLANFDNGSRVTDAEGNARLDDLARDAYRVEATKEGWVNSGPTASARVEPGANAPARVILRPGP